MSSDTWFENDTYDFIMEVQPFGDPLPDWLLVSYTDNRDPDNPVSVGCNALRPTEIQELRDALDAWLEDSHE